MGTNNNIPSIFLQSGDTRKFCMYFILPDAHDGLPALLDKITSEPGFLNRHIPSRQVEVGKLLIPNFKTTFGFEAPEVLKGLGLTLPFFPGGLDKMVDSAEAKALFVSNMFHKSFIEVNGGGTEAAAATAAVIKVSRKFEAPPDFVADHPFLFLIRDESTGVVLFTGSVLNPRAD
ncbi:Serpin-ZX [Capsicum annuum]|nr:Serpin-ZX [Capsicum annuum]